MCKINGKIVSEIHIQVSHKQRKKKRGSERNIQLLNTGVCLAKNSSLESCASSEELPNRVLKMMAHGTEHVRCFVKRSLCLFSLSSPNRFSVNPRVFVPHLVHEKPVFLCRCPLRGCRLFHCPGTGLGHQSPGDACRLKPQKSQGLLATGVFSFLFFLVFCFDGTH